MVYSLRSREARLGSQARLACKRAGAHATNNSYSAAVATGVSFSARLMRAALPFRERR